MNGALLFANVNGNYFVASVNSMVLSIFAVMASVLLTQTFEAIVGTWGEGPHGYGAACIYIAIYASRKAFKMLTPVDLAEMTLPEDHIRRYNLTKIIAKK
eukprot:UN33033